MGPGPKVLPAIPYSQSGSKVLTGVPEAPLVKEPALLRPRSLVHLCVYTSVPAWGTRSLVHRCGRLKVVVILKCICLGVAVRFGLGRSAAARHRARQRGWCLQKLWNLMEAPLVGNHETGPEGFRGFSGRWLRGIWGHIRELSEFLLPKHIRMVRGLEPLRRQELMVNGLLPPWRALWHWGTMSWLNVVSKSEVGEPWLLGVPAPARVVVCSIFRGSIKFDTEVPAQTRN